MRRFILLALLAVLLIGIVPGETSAANSYQLDCRNANQTIWVTKGQPVWLDFGPNRGGQHYISFWQFPYPEIGAVKVTPFWYEGGRNGSWKPYSVTVATTTIALWSGTSQVSYRFKIENQTMESEKGLSISVACAAAR